MGSIYLYTIYTLVIVGSTYMFLVNSILQMFVNSTLTAGLFLGNSEFEFNQLDCLVGLICTAIHGDRFDAFDFLADK